MTREEAKALLESRRDLIKSDYPEIDDYREALDMAIEALKQEPCEDEIILTKEEYGQLLSNEFDNGYAKGYREALKQEDFILDKIKAEIEQIEIIGHIRDIECFRAGINVALNVIDKYKAGEEYEDN